jgi:anaerobic magnesium-protoporphyrin IX monomethyl ester cyclase
MRVVLLYPPPWKISRPGRSPYPPGEGPPAGWDPDAALSADLAQAPYGLLSLAAQAIRAGFRVTILNVADFPWPAVELLLDHLDAEVFGLSCLTANRRGVAMTARAIRRRHPRAHIVVGGPHVTALPVEMLRHVPEIDTAVVGEGEKTFLELLDRLARGGGAAGIAGTVARRNGEIVRGAPREAVTDLDALASPADYFHLRTLLTSRGCPMHCTFCSSRLMWGRRLRLHSVGYVLDTLEKTVAGYGQKIVAIKDDTFTADRQRVLAICEGIAARGLKFIWSCDTRADCLDDELLYHMRVAGCARISLGVESAAPAILKNIRKRIGPETVMAATRMAQTYGLQVRYYMMVGNRGETWETFQQSLKFIEATRPNQFVFSQLHLYPGTEEFAIFENNGLASAEVFFERDFLSLTAFAGAPRDEARIRSVLQHLGGVRSHRHYDVTECRCAAAVLPDLPALHMDLCRAYLREGRPDEAERHLSRAAGYALPGLVLNGRACVAAARNDLAAASQYLKRALGYYPHPAALENKQRLADWSSAGGRPTALDPGEAFETGCIYRQPEYPDPYGLAEPLEAHAAG